jgi:hypothetical protein
MQQRQRHFRPLTKSDKRKIAKWPAEKRDAFFADLRKGEREAAEQGRALMARMWYFLHEVESRLLVSFGLRHAGHEPDPAFRPEDFAEELAKLPPGFRDLFPEVYPPEDAQ